MDYGKMARKMTTEWFAKSEQGVTCESFIDFIERHTPTAHKISEEEREDLGYAFKDDDWSRILRYAIKFKVV